MFDPAKAQRIVDGIANGELLSDICAEIGVTRATVWNWKQANPKFLTQCAHARASSASVDEENVATLMREVKSGEVEPDAARVILNGYTWLAKVRCPEVYAEKSKHEHSGPGGGPVQSCVTVRFVDSGHTGSVPVPVVAEG